MKNQSDALALVGRILLGLIFVLSGFQKLMGFSGVAGGIALSRYLSSLFFGVSPTNPATYVEVALLMIGISLVACLLPAWRAIRVNPMVALRYE